MNKIYQSGVSCLLFLCLAFSTRATIYPFHNVYSGANEIPANASTAKATIVGTYNDVTNQISYSIVFSGLTTNSTAAHFHGPATTAQSAGVVIAHAGFPTGVTLGFYSGSQTLTEAQEAQLLAGLWYSNIHSTTFPAGEIRAQIIMGDRNTISPFRNTYSGTNGVPVTPSTATGMIIGTYNHQTNLIAYSIVFSGLTTNSTAAHFHGPATPTQSASVIQAHTGFPTGVTSGFVSASHTLTNAQETQLLSGLWYSNIHSTTYPAGEIRTQILLTDILPPSISNVVVNPSELWPANHKMKDITVGYTSTDNFPAPVTCSLTVSSNEPVTSASDETTPDWLVTNSNAAKLRAERSGEGDGRVYTLTVTCTDAQGNSASRTATVTVPHDQSGAITRAGSIDRENCLPGVRLTVLPNPSNNYFTIGIKTGPSAGKIQLRLYDISGRLVESRINVTGDQNLQMGKNLGSGIYLLKLYQGNEVRQLRLVKLD